MSKSVQLPIQFFILDKFVEGLLDEWGDDGDEFPYCNISLSEIQKRVSLNEKGKYAVPIIRWFLYWLLITNQLDTPSDAKLYQKNIYTVFNPAPDVSHPAARYPGNFFRLENFPYALARTF